MLSLKLYYPDGLFYKSVEVPAVATVNGYPMILKHEGEFWVMVGNDYYLPYVPVKAV